jgi:uncharacterized protein YjlB
VIPNNARWPLVLYRGAISLPSNLDPAAVMEDLFEENGWGDSWRNGIYDYVHYHSRIHEVLGIARGKGTVRFGGNNGRTIQLKAGDVAILPAGTGHQCLGASVDFLVVGPTRHRAPTTSARKAKNMPGRLRRSQRSAARERIRSMAPKDRL